MASVYGTVCALQHVDVEAHPWQPAPLIPSIPQDEREGGPSATNPLPTVMCGRSLHELVAAHDARRLLVHDHVHAGRLAGGEGALGGGGGQVHDIAAVADDDRVVVDELRYVAAEAQGVDGHAV